MSDQPIAAYDEIRFDGKRTFTLYADSILIKGVHSLQSEFETRIILNTIDPNLEILRIRNPNFIAGIRLFLAAGAIWAVLVFGFNFSGYSFLPGLAGMISLVGFLLSFYTRKKVEYARFKNSSGMIVLDIAKAGREVHNFEGFVQKLTQQIKSARAHASPNHVGAN
ncbi:MAG: hypothetical protein HS116_27495 [Planctomycetes bacterium]|nr:hypothetical protein [Planctomycetota bacterium]